MPNVCQQEVCGLCSVLSLFLFECSLSLTDKVCVKKYTLFGLGKSVFGHVGTSYVQIPTCFIYCMLRSKHIYDFLSQHQRTPHVYLCADQLV